MVVRGFLFDSNGLSRQQVPHWWRNFVHGVLPPLSQRPARNWEQSMHMLNGYLVPWHAVYWLHHDQDKVTRRYIDFYDEHAYTWFLLNWS